MKPQPSTRRNVNLLQDPDFYRTQNILLFICCLLITIGYQVLPLYTFAVDGMLAANQKGYVILSEKQKLMDVSMLSVLGAALGHLAGAMCIFSLIVYKKLAIQKKLIMALLGAVILSVVLLMAGNLGQVEAIESALKALSGHPAAEKLIAGSKVTATPGTTIYLMAGVVAFLLVALRFNQKDEQLLKNANRFW